MLPDHDGLKVGLALMSALSDQAQFSRVPDGGTEVLLSFRTPTNGLPDSRPSPLGEGGGFSAWPTGLHPGLVGDVVLTVSPVALLAPVLGRIGRALAPSAGFSPQRCSDVWLLSDVLGAHAEGAADAQSISVALDARNRKLEFALAPLRPGTSARLERAGSRQRPGKLAGLTDDVIVSAFDGHETLRVSMRDHLRG